MYNCTVPSLSHAWTVSTTPQITGIISRGNENDLDGDFKFQLVQDNQDSIISSLSVVSFAEFNGVTISCRDANVPVEEAMTETTIAMVIVG